MSIIRKSTNKELVAELQKRNTAGRYDSIIAKAQNNWYHDYKNPDEVVCGKWELLKDLVDYPELSDIENDVLAGHYDEQADEEDKEKMRKELPPTLWRQFGL